jgi:hypothetical protein
MWLGETPRIVSDSGVNARYCDLNHKMAVLNHNLADDDDDNHLPSGG